MDHRKAHKRRPDYKPGVWPKLQAPNSTKFAYADGTPFFAVLAQPKESLVNVPLDEQSSLGKHRL